MIRSKAWSLAGLLAMVGLWGSMSLAAEAPGGAVVDLKFVELKEGASSWHGLAVGKDGNCTFPMGKKQLLLKYEKGKLRADTNGDGAVDEKDAPAVTLNASDRSESRLRIPVKIGGQAVEYPLCFRLIDAGKQPFVIVGSAGAMEGTFEKFTIRISGIDMSGEVAPGQNQVTIHGPGAEAGRSDVPLCRMMWIGGKLYTADVIDSGAKLKLTPYTGEVAEVKVLPPKGMQVEQITLVGAGFTQAGTFGAQEAPKFVPGKYRIGTVALVTGKKEPENVLFGYHDYNTAPLELRAGLNVVKVGPPLSMDFAATHKDGAIVFTAAMIKGQAGELYRPNVEEKDTFAAYIRSGGKEMKLAKLEFS